MSNECPLGHAIEENPIHPIWDGNVQSSFTQASTRDDFTTGAASNYIEIVHTVNLNTASVSLIKSKNYARAEIILKITAELNEHHELSSDPLLALQGTYQRAKNGDNLAFGVYTPQKRFNEAVKEIEKEVIPRYKTVLQTGMVQAGSDLAVTYYKLSELYEKLADKADVCGKQQMTTAALNYKAKSLALWKTYAGSDSDQIKNAEKTTATTANKMRKASFPKKA